ncbi:type I restriction-modification system subunit M [Acinetobacter sp. ANC 5414]|nr:type I restriction-modification system subunit M [Acinetobacter sp. ANC 5414]
MDGEEIRFLELDKQNPEHIPYIEEIKKNAIAEVGYALTPKQLFHTLAQRGRQGEFILDDLTATLKSIEQSTLGTDSADDFANLFEDLDLNSTKLGNKDVDMIYGQEMNRTTYNLARMNMILHDVHFAKFDIKQENTLTRPQHLDKKFAAVVANPPFSANWSADPLFLQDERFAAYGKLAPSSKADMAFVQHMLYQLDDNGTMAVVLPHGVLFRGSSEGVIRHYLIEQLNVIDAVIGLPANIFYGTSIPTCILVLKKNREHTGNILFIDASNGFEKQKNQNKLLPEHLDHIIAAFEKRQDIEKYAHVATLQEVKDNDYNLNIPRYVDTFEAEAEIDLDAIVQQLQALEVESQKTDAVIANFCKELGIASPFAEVK